MDAIEKTKELEEGVRAVAPAKDAPDPEGRAQKKLKIDKKNLIIYSEIMRPKFEE